MLRSVRPVLSTERGCIVSQLFHLGLWITFSSSFMDGQTSLDQIPWFRSSADEIGLIPIAIELAFVKRLSKALLKRQCKFDKLVDFSQKGTKGSPINQIVCNPRLYISWDELPLPFRHRRLIRNDCQPRCRNSAKTTLSILQTGRSGLTHL